MYGIFSLYFTQIALIQPDLLTSKPFVSQLSKTDVLFKVAVCALTIPVEGSSVQLPQGREGRNWECLVQDDAWAYLLQDSRRSG